MSVSTNTTVQTGESPWLRQAAAALEEFARAARQTGQYPAYHPVMTAALERARQALLKLFAPDSSEPVRLTTTPSGLQFNEEALPAGGAGARWLNRELRKRLIKTLCLQPGLQVTEVEGLLALLAAEPEEILEKGVSEWLASRGLRGVEAEQQDYNRLLRESEARLVKMAPTREAAGVKRVVNLCMGVLQGSGESAAEDTAAPAEGDADEDDPKHSLPVRLKWLLDSISPEAGEAAADKEKESLPAGWEKLLEAEISPEDLLAMSLGNLIQVSYESLGKSDAGIEQMEARAKQLREWQEQLTRLVFDLEAELRARLFRIPIAVSPGYADALGQLAAGLTPQQVIGEIVMTHPGGVAAETSSALRRLLQRIMPTAARQAEVEPLLRARLLADGMTEETYRNVVELLCESLDKERVEVPEEGPLRVHGAEAGSLRKFRPVAIDDLLESLDEGLVDRAHTEMLIDLLQYDSSPSEYAGLCAELARWPKKWQERNEDELALRLVYALAAEATGPDNTPSYRVIAASALRRLDTPDFVAWLAQKFIEADKEEGERLLALLVALGENAGHALLEIVLQHADEEVIRAAAVAMCRAEESRPDKTAARGAKKPVGCALRPEKKSEEGGHLLGLLADAMVSAPADRVLRVARVLIASRCPQAQRPLGFALRHAEVRVRIGIVQALGEARPEGFEKILFYALQDAHWEVRARAARALAEMSAQLTKASRTQALGALSPAAREEGLNVRTMVVRLAALEALGELGSAEAVPLLAEILTARGWLFSKARNRLRMAAVQALEKIDDAAAREALRAGCERAPRAVAQRCEEALERAQKRATRAGVKGAGE